jgi:hypothetical protein
MVVVDDDGGTGRGAPSSLGNVPGLGQVTRPCWRDGSSNGAPSLGLSWPVFSTDEYGLCWACDSTPPSPLGVSSCRNMIQSSTASGGSASSGGMASK